MFQIILFAPVLRHQHLARIPWRSDLAVANCAASVYKIGVYKRVVIPLLVAMITTIAVSGCGQKGTLYLPPSNSDVNSSQPDDSQKPTPPQQ